MSKIRIDQLSNEITKVIREYTEEVEEEVARARDDVTKQAVDTLKRNSPKKTGVYAKAWTRKKQSNSFIVYNLKKSNITHLLEYGYVKRGGGRVPGKAHIRPVEEQAVKEFEKRVEKAIKT